ncbi:antibiotic biosynthesis monooxygenase family protein [Enterobacter ludwigii]|uniref:antibiotic biosynthesis monooxygenase family protein n=1 Tax=Enterobacter TaxID=547 RepID=UPI000793BB17|nr:MULTISPECIES: antibiotic biosynthesis monooxygenase family protein [Enterobacter]MDR6400466.1 heme-degrading monooxygenase HmoA [Enterobacter ludwigii]OUC37416.1 antibiotic biosynthesis monooxygenase [Enterobacter sp. J49]WPL54256.1 antibiotic biosynthesis monooxygenase family protein [Enterobacter ludwigii]WRM05912.1 antibiotic biosynthesis monooxygenase family protein [Enterobacter ludwigii]CZU51312.1 Antibiotic biosynthesis monooxygenase [Enterobacter ludwigii]
MAAIKPFKPLDEKFPFDRQLGVAVAPLVLINLFAVLDPADEVGFLDAFKAAAEVITKQPGFISMQLHRAIGDSPTYLNYVVWESTEAVRAAFTDPEFLAKLPAYPSSVVASPHLFQKVAVPGFCTA